MVVRLHHMTEGVRLPPLVDWNFRFKTIFENVMARVCIFEEARSKFLEIYLTWYFPNAGFVTII